MKAILNVDGASRGNPGQASCAAVIKTGDDRERELGLYLGVATNNVAEYAALIAGLTECLEMGITDVDIRSDSELCVRQIKGEYKVRNEGLAVLHRKVLGLLSRFEKWDIRHVRREENKAADSISNRVLDLRALIN
ncbi:MAG: ribonuclease HI family protein [Bacillota bacterium]|jgi:ribonuclease HI|nr:ribonuclease HI family protein [Candidatus Fermentithermobacillaceae bacterium]